ncbi:MAG: hypothetical protein KDA32_13855, partial [Phycisphaerales bacterium]|nr:hypothetical protein [Phycisphaerales bacterium]
MNRHLVPHHEDPTVPADLARKHGLRGGETVTGETVAGDRNGTRVVQLVSVTAVNDVPIDEWTPPPPLQETTAIDPDERLHFDTPGGPVSMRVVELFTPIGRGQRGLIVAPPRTGKTILLQQLAHGISTNHPDVYMIVL